MLFDVELLYCVDIALRFMGIFPYFSAVLTMGNSFHDFLFASLDDKTFQNGSLLLKERICFKRSKVFPLSSCLVALIHTIPRQA